MMKIITPAAAAMSLVAAMSVYAQTPSAAVQQTQSAVANLVDAENQPVGSARLRQAPHGVVVTLELTNAPAGTHALHIHQVGRCDAPSFDSAGGHFEPGGKKHGFLNTAGPHAGDLPNIVVPESRKLSAEYLVDHVKLAAGTSGLMDADGAALMLHSGRDDYASDPAGNAGSRMACGVIVADRH